MQALIVSWLARDQYLKDTIMETARRVQELEQLTAELEGQKDDLRIELARAREDREILENVNRFYYCRPFLLFFKTFILIYRSLMTSKMITWL